MDGIDTSEILLMNNYGCPTDLLIMGPLEKRENGKVLQAPFDAFKFPSSDVVQFKAFVTPCLPKCLPANCELQDFDGQRRDVDLYGRKRRSLTNSTQASDEFIIVQQIKISDNFPIINETSEEYIRTEEKFTVETECAPENCVTLVGIISSCVIFLILQFILIVTFICVKNSKTDYYKNQIQNGYVRQFSSPIILPGGR